MAVDQLIISNFGALKRQGGYDVQALGVDIRIGLVGGGPVKGSSTAPLLVIRTRDKFEHIPKSAHLDLMIPVVEVLKVIIHDQAILPSVRPGIPRGFGWHLLHNWGRPEFPSSKGILQCLRGMLSMIWPSGYC